MRKIAKPVFLILVIIGAFIVGFLFLLRGCLSKYDERSSLTPVVYLKKDGKSVLFSIVKFEKAQSYSRKGNMVSKSVSTTYYVQSNDAVSGKKLSEKKVKHHSDIKHYPIELIGESNGNAWVFIGEPMAFDVMTLEEVANIEILEKKNPAMKGKFPEERRFYEFDYNTGSIIITANDGSLWELDSEALLVRPMNEIDKPDSKSAYLKSLEKQLRKNQILSDSLMKNGMDRTAQRLARKEISPAQYRTIVEGFYDQRKILNATRDSLRTEFLKADKTERYRMELVRKIESLRRNSGSRFTSMKSNSDSVGGKWYGIFSSQEMESLYERFQHHAPHAEAARRQLYVSSLQPKLDDLYFDRANAVLQGKNYFLNGGFLLDKSTALPIKLSPTSFLVVHKTIVGNEGTVLLTRLNADGTIQWTYDTQLKDWADWCGDTDRLIVLGNDNKELSGNDINLLISIDLKNGTAVKYDYFQDENR